MNSDDPINSIPDDARQDTRYPGLEARLERLYAHTPPAHLVLAMNQWASKPEEGTVSLPVTAARMSHRSHRRSMSWLSAIAASLLVLVVVATVATATGLIEWGRYFQAGFGTERIAQEGLGTDLDLTQQVDGFTVTIGRVYADPFSIAMTVRITPPDGLPPGRVDVRQSALYDEAGNFLSGPGAQIGAEDDTMVRTFYNNALTPGSTSAHYRFEITDLRFAVQPQVVDEEVVPIQEVLSGVPCQREPAYRGQPIDEASDETFCYLIASQPLVFEFDVPIGPGVAVAPGEQTASNGSVVNVTRVTGGRIGALVDIEGVGPFASVSIETGGQTFPLATYGYACPYDATTPFNYITDQPIPLDSGPWTVRIVADPAQVPANAGDYPPAAGPCGQIEPRGDWVFWIDPLATTLSGPGS